MFVSQHAVERFRKRFAGGLSHGHALRELILLTKTARRLRENAEAGRERWEAADGSGMILIVERTHGARRIGDGLTCVTVLRGDETDDPDVPE